MADIGPIEQPAFHYFECQDCGFDSVQRADFSGSEICPVCAGDNGRDVLMHRRIALSTDTAEGFDARKGTRREQLAAKSDSQKP